MNIARKFFFIFLFCFFAVVFKIYFQKIGAFGCFDDCNIFAAAQFMVKGKRLYSEIFFNHQPLMVYLSYLIQLIFHPATIYKLVAEHRIFILLFSFAMDILIIVRFKWIGAGYVLFYEMTKFYFFGDRFLPEAVIAQPFAYLLGLSWNKLVKQQIYFIDFLLSGVLIWFIVFMREPYIPAAIFLYVLILWNKNFFKEKTVSLLIFFILSLVAIFTLPIHDYFYQVVSVNLSTMVPSELSSNGIFGIGFVKIFSYPLLIIYDGKWTFIRQVLIGIDIVFLISSCFLLIFGSKQIKITIFLLFLALGLSNIRFVPPGTMFYEAFHMLEWYSLFLMSIFLTLDKIRTYKNGKKIFYLLMYLMVGILLFVIFSPKAFIWDKVDKDTEFTTNYAHFFVYGSAIKYLANKNDTMFVDIWDDFLYWEGNLKSSYRYSLYTPETASFEQYRNERSSMFSLSPPDFYYTHCDNGKVLFPQGILPAYLVNEYIELWFGGKRSCLYIKKSKLPQINTSQWDKVKSLGFYIRKKI